MKYITAALGNFDGIHIGHDKIIKRCIEVGNNCKQDKKIITFEYKFDQFANRPKKMKKIYGKNGKIASLKNYDIDDIIFFTLDENTAKMSPEDFVSDVLINKLQIRNIIVGFNFRFGYKAKGDTNLLLELSKKYGFTIEVINAVKTDGFVVSSTIIRNLIEDGKIEEANNLLIDRFRIDLRDHKIYKRDINEIIIVSGDFVYPKNGEYLISSDGDKQKITFENINNRISIRSNISLDKEIIEFVTKI